MNEASLIQMMNKPEVVIRKCVTAENAIAGCVYLETRQKELYLGLLSVSPDIQATGIGKIMLNDAEEVASKQKLSGIVMSCFFEARIDRLVHSTGFLSYR